MLVLLAAVAMALSPGAAAEQASEPPSPAAAQLDAGTHHTCALLAGGSVRCWGFGGDGRLGYGNSSSIGDDENPSFVGPVDLGAAHTAKAIGAGAGHTCALLDDNSVRCWGFGGNGRLGYNSERNFGDDEAPGSAGPVNFGPGRSAKAISAGGFHTCAVLDDDTVRCWGYGGNGRLGYGNEDSIGNGFPDVDTDNDGRDDVETTPENAGAVKLGPGRTAKAISAGADHTCALLDDNSVRCWGLGLDGQLGYGDGKAIGDTETPDTVGPVNLGPPGRTAKAISVEGNHTCAVLDDDSVRCWGYGPNGQLGYGNSNSIGDNEAPGSVGPVDLGPNRSARAISAGGAHTCARLDDASVRCWGIGADGQLGYGNTATIGDNELPGSVGPVDLGPGRSATAIGAGGTHTCARLDEGSVRCWGNGADGRLGYCNASAIGDDETPGSAGPVSITGTPALPGASIGDARLIEGDSGEVEASFAVSICASTNPVSVDFATADDSARAPDDYESRSGTATFNPGDTRKTVVVRVRGDTLDEPDGRFFISLSNPSNATVADGQGDGTIRDDDPPPGPSPPRGGAVTTPLPGSPQAGAGIDWLATQAARARDLRSCLAAVEREASRERARARRGSASQRARARRQLTLHRSSGRRRCLRLHGRTPGPVTGVAARAVSGTDAVLTFNAAGTDGTQPPAAGSYLVKQSLRPIRSTRDFARAQPLCKGACRFANTQVSAQLTLTVTDLRPRSTYHYAIAARDNVSGRLGPRSASVSARIR